MPERFERVISRRVINEQVLGSANPVARWGRKSKGTCLDSIGGFIVGLILFFVTFLIPFSAARTEKDSKDVSKLSVISPEQASTVSGKALVEGPLTLSNIPKAPYGDSNGIAAYNFVVQDFETKIVTEQETHTEVQNGQDVKVTEEVKKEVSDWVTKEDRTEWADMSLGAIRIEDANVNIQLGWEETYNKESNAGKHREIVTVIRPPQKVLLATELSNGQIAQNPDFAILTPQSKDELVASMNATEEGLRWAKIVFSIILWTVSLNLLVGPAMVLLNIVPIEAVGCMARAIVTGISLLIACLLTFVVYFLTAYWWLVLIVIVGLAVLAFSLANKNKRASPQITGGPAGAANLDELPTNDNLS